MTDQQKLDIKLKIIKEFKGYHYTLVEVFQILDDLKRDLSGLAVEQELKKMKFKLEKKHEKNLRS